MSPNISLDVYGYVDHRDNDEAMTKINAAIKKYHLEDDVKPHDYVKDVGRSSVKHKSMRWHRSWKALICH